MQHRELNKLGMMTTTISLLFICN